MKRKLLFLATLVVSALGMRAQMTDVTSTYITNADFSGTYSSAYTNLADLTDGGKFYIRNVGNGKYWGAGNEWGTRASLVDRPAWVILHKQSNGTYTIESQVINGDTNYWFDGDYMDGGESGALPLIINGTGTAGEYYISNSTVFNGPSLFGYDGSTTVLGKGLTDVSSDNAKWVIMTEAELATDLNLAAATADAPKDATWLIKDPNFGRNNRDASNWSGTELTKAGDNTNMNVQAYMATFDTYQELSSIPNGVYSVTAQAAVTYHDNRTVKDYDGSNPVIVYLNDATTFTAFNEMETADQLSNQNQMSTSFNAGKYAIEPLWVKVEDGTLKIGAKSTRNDIWAVWDNFEMLYYGNAGSIAEVRLASFVAAYKTALTEAQAFTKSSMFADDRTTLQDAITANTLDLNDPSLTEGQVTNATNNLVAANTAATAAVTYYTAVTTINSGTNVDLTSLITNPGFEDGNTTGWNNDGAITANAQNNDAFDKRQGTWYAERWHVNGTIDINQTVKFLPAGIYKIDAYMYSDTGNAKLYVNSENVSVSTSGQYTATVEIADKGSIKMGASCTLTESTWICLDDFKLTYVGTVNDLTYTLATGKMGTDKSAAQTAAEATFLNNKTPANYNALLTAIADAEASIANYATLKRVIDIAEGELAGTNFVTADATTALENEISTATTAWSKETYTDQEAKDKAGEIKGHIGNYLGSAWITPDPKPEVWWYINTWSIEGDTDGTDFFNPFFENFKNDTEDLPENTFTASLTGLDNGRYEVEVWARVQRRTDANFNFDGNAMMIKMSVNGGDAVSIMNGTTVVNEGDNNEMRLGRFVAQGEVSDGTLTLTINVSDGSNVHWLSWRDVKYTKLDEANMSVKASKWGTFIAPFDVEIPANVEAYKVTGINGTSMTKEAVTTTIPANTPVVLKNPTTTAINETFYGKSTATKDSYTEGVLTGVYTAAIIPASTETVTNYVLQTHQDGVQAFYKVAADFTATPNRCYLTVDSSTNPVKAIFFDEDATGIEGIAGALDSEGATIFNAAGARVNGLQKGVNIIRTADGKVRKVMVK